jgi:hypothetical protein
MIYKKGDVVCFTGLKNITKNCIYIIEGYTVSHRMYKVRKLGSNETSYIETIIDNMNTWKKVKLSDDEKILLKI